MKRLVPTLACAAALLAPPSASAAKPAALKLDPGFGKGGTSAPDLPLAFGGVRFVSGRVEDDGTVLAARHEDRNGDEVAGLFRYAADGAPAGELEERFDQSGPEVPDAEGNFLRPAGNYVKRMLPDGSPDTSFGTVDANGRRTSDWIFCEVEAVMPLPSGQILAGGHGCLARLEHDGKLDESFGVKGVVDLEKIGVKAQRLVAIEPGANGDAVLVLDKVAKEPYSERTAPDGSLAAAVTPQAILDPGYGQGGIVEFPFEIGSAAGTPDGGLVLGGDTAGKTEYVKDPRGDLALTRLSSTGAVEAGFGTGGTASLDLGGFDLLHSLILEPDGAILVGGATTATKALCLEFYEDFCEETPYLARFRPDGSIDLTYGEGGVERLASLTASHVGVGGQGVLDLAPRPGGGVLATGGSGADAFLAELDPHGTLDPGFAGDGIHTERVSGNSRTHLRELGVDSKGRILATAGTSAGAAPGAPGGALMRLHADGSLDRGYGEGGLVRVPGNLRELAIAPDGGAFVLSGEFAPNLVAHVTPQGTLDRSFGIEGAAPLPEMPAIVRHGKRRPMTLDPRALVPLPDGGVLVGGESGESGAASLSRMAVMKFDRRGRLDRSFGKRGLAILPFGWRGNSNLADMARAPGGRVLLAGKVRIGRPQHRVLAIAAIGADGKLDRGFGRRGLALVPMHGESRATTIAWGHGGFYVGGYHDTKTGYPFLLLRFDAGGRLDRGFRERFERSVPKSLKPHDYLYPEELLVSGGRIAVLGGVGGAPLSLFAGSGTYLGSVTTDPQSRPRERVITAANQKGRLVVAFRQKISSFRSTFVLRRYLPR